MKIVLTLASFCIFTAGLVNFFLTSHKKRFTQRLLTLTLSMVAAVLLVEAVHYMEDPGADGIFPTSVLVDAMQVFSLDGDYDKAMAHETIFGSGFADGLALLYRAVLYTAAPVIGGAVIFDVLAGVSPGLKLFFVRRRELYVFSELNEYSVTLAESVCGENKRKGPCIVFTDCCTDGQSEVGYELMGRASAVSAICLPEDIVHSGGFRKSRRCSFFLMDTGDNGELDDMSNLSTLRGIMSVDNAVWNMKKDCTVFFFTNDSETVEKIRTVKADFRKACHKDEHRRLTLRIVRDYAQTTGALLKEHPLFEVARVERKEPLRVLLLGNNSFSREMFKGIFWCGQLLEHPLSIGCVYAPDGSRPFADWLNKLSPEIIESCTEESECLRLYPDRGYNQPYASLCMVEEDVSRGNMRHFLSRVREFQWGAEKAAAFEDFDYFIVMTGDDALNSELAEELRRALLYKEARDGKRKKLIAAAIENNDLSSILRSRYSQLNASSDCAVKMYVFGSIAERYSRRNVFLDGAYLAAGDADIADKQAHHGLKGFDETVDDFYNEWSSVSRLFHIPYKMFSAGIAVSAPHETDTARSLEEKTAYCRALSEDKQLWERLLWLEHRRWNAFIRTQGFSCPPGMRECILRMLEGKLSSRDWQSLSLYAYKNIPARLHSCLVEACEDSSGQSMDMLDGVSMLRALVKAGKKADEEGANTGHVSFRDLPPDNTLKKYDAPNGKNSPRFNREELYLWLTGSLLPKDRKQADALWQSTLRENDFVEQCGDPRLPGSYFVELLLQASAELR